MEELSIERVRAMLHAKLSGRGINVDEVYINGVHSLENLQVTYSQTLVWALYLELQDAQVPYFEGEHLGLFSKSYTFDSAYRFKGLEFDEVNDLAANIAKLFLSESVV
ncbi:hypothetical protein SAMN04490202_1697 [Pseudomonas reinekei]|uniref:Uncharacterized protein n=1 Tax=Pseudomonas reinekei TaxID=395598 RepID=A0A1H0LZH5_PSERE|nr:hypothetical protein [Pseudomonas reinekei]KAB0484699.1 hypothetical protein F7R15_15400 [Pseudomonas reinekei]OLU01508.1 hypothetical protein BVK86_17305 [Pseudomonas reinekei]SDO73619.1 hypothetical protein SAMN04490202_1697 [Pseudomonas reinekei]